MFGLGNKEKKKVTKMDENFVAKNKNALIEEMAENINNINALINAATQAGPTEDPAHELSVIKNVVIAMAQNAGALTSCFNQYIIFETGNVTEEKRIGFQALLKDKDEP